MTPTNHRHLRPVHSIHLLPTSSHRRLPNFTPIRNSSPLRLNTATQTTPDATDPSTRQPRSRHLAEIPSPTPPETPGHTLSLILFTELPPPASAHEPRAVLVDADSNHEPLVLKASSLPVVHTTRPPPSSPAVASMAASRLHCQHPRSPHRPPCRASLELRRPTRPPSSASLNPSATTPEFSTPSSLWSAPTP